LKESKIELWFDPEAVTMVLFEKFLIAKPIILQPAVDLLLSVDRTPHPLWKQLSLVAGLCWNKP